MRVVLHEAVKGLGNRGDVVDVADGYARNFLIPTSKAQKANDGVEAQAEAMRKAWQLRNAKDREAAEEIAKVLVARPVTVTARASAEGKLFGSVSAADIVAATVEQTGVELDRKMLQLDEGIREVGTHSVMAAPHDEVQFPITVEVVAS